MPACALRCTALHLLVLMTSWRAAAAPVIDSVRQTPAIPRPADAVKVEARSPGATCSLRWRVDGGSFQTKPMTDTDGDGRVEATLDAQPNGTVIEFFIDATDPSGSASWPAGSTGALWQSDSSFPTGAWTPGAQPLCFAVLREQDRAALTAAAGGAGYSGTFLTVDGSGTSVRYGCTFRSSGGTPLGLTVAFPADNPWQGRAALELNSHFPHSQVLSAAVWRRAGLPAGEAAPVKFRLNGVDHAETGVRMFGSYARAEAPGPAWMTRQYPLDALGNLYSVSDAGPGTHGELAYELPATPANYAETYFPLTNIAGAGYTDVIALTNKLSNAPEATYKAEISQVLNLDQWLSFLALDALTGSVKPGLQSGRGTDFHIYRGVNDARFVLIPHAMDTSFGLGENGNGDPVARSIFSYEGVQGLNRMMNHPDILPDYYAKLLSLSETVFNHTVIDPLADQWLGGWADAATVQQVKNFITARRAGVLAQVPQVYGMTVTTAAPDVEGMKQTTDGSAAASGTFHAGQVRSIRVNGLPATLYYRTAGANAAGTWTCAIPAGNSILLPGVSILKTKFYDGPNGTGNVVKELTATIFRSGAGTDVSGMLGTTPAQNLFKYGVYSSTPANNVPGSVWKYLTNGTNPGPAWKNEGFNDTSWSSAATQIGYGEAQRDEQTLVTRVDYVPGTSGTQSAPTYYFRNTFTIADLSTIASVPGEVKYDDGAVVYVNGTEILRTTNLAPDAGHDSYADFNGAASRENALAPFTIPLALLHNGVNTIAVEVHQESASSTDLTFDLKLDAVPKPTVTAFQWTRAGSPYHLTGDTTIPSGVTLTIDPGVSVFADPGRRLIISGVIKALGTEDARLRFSNVPGAPLQDDPREPGTQMVPPKWGGILVTDSLSSENIIKYADFVNAQPTAVEGSITVLRSECLVDHCSFRLTYLHGVYGKNCSLTVQNCYFPSVYPPGKESLGEALDNLSEFVEVDSPPNDPAIEDNPAFFEGFPVGGHIRLYRNVFEGATGHNDLVDVTSGKWGLTPVFDVQDNVFLGPTGDEHLDLNGDAYIAGNFFQNCKKDIYTSDHGYANAVSADVTEEETTVVVTRNVFTRVDHGVNVKSGVGAIFEHNTMVDINQDYHFERGTGQNLFVQDVKTSAINFFIPEDTGPEPGDGAYVAFNLFYGSVPPGEGAPSGFPRVFSGADMVDEDEPPFTTKIEMSHNFLDPAILDPVIGTSHPENVYAPVWLSRVGDPLFVDRAGKNFNLQAHSPARGTAPLGLDYGAGIAPGCYLGNVPPVLTSNAVASITIGGPGIFAFQWRIDGGAWSAPVQIAPGVFSLSVPTVRTAVLTTPSLSDGLHTLEVIGQDFAGNWQTTPSSASWTVQATLQRIVISEVLADAFAGPDTVEFHNAGASSVSLTGWFLTNDSADPDKYPLAGTIPAGAWMTFTIPGLDLDAAGDDLHLFQGVVEKDAVIFGSQAARLSIGRIGRDGQWTLCTPTPNAANTPVKTGPPSSLRFNEWLAAPAVRFSSGWVEVANTGAIPVALAGLAITNNTPGNPSAFAFPPLSFIAAGGFLKLIADSSGAPGHLPFALDPGAGRFSLSGQGTVLDFVDFGSQTADTSMGRDAAGALVFYSNPTGGSANVLTEPSSYLPWLAWHATTQGSDDDNDSLSAFAEYALGTNPRSAAVIPLQTAGPPAQITVYLPQNAAAPQGHGKPEVTYTVQASDSLDSPSWSTLATKTPLASWTNPSAVTIGTPAGGFVPVTIQDTPAAPAKPRRFVRMMMTWTP